MLRATGRVAVPPVRPRVPRQRRTARAATADGLPGHPPSVAPRGSRGEGQPPADRRARVARPTSGFRPSFEVGFLHLPQVRTGNSAADPSGLLPRRAPTSWPSSAAVGWSVGRRSSVILRGLLRARLQVIRAGKDGPAAEGGGGGGPVGGCTGSPWPRPYPRRRGCRRGGDRTAGRGREGAAAAARHAGAVAVAPRRRGSRRGEERVVGRLRAPRGPTAHGRRGEHGGPRPYD
ncbi:hypothetical protein T45_08994 [Streptomyces turgidiscabies]|nr:hypothetical protein T45_08994 [Streptomyces turgidiscabies]